MRITNRTKKEQIMAMNNLYGHDLEYCSKKLQDDEEVVLKFIESYWGHYEYASDRLKKDRMFIKLAIQKSMASFLYADESLRKDKKFIMELIELSNARIINYAHYPIDEEMYEHLKPHAIEYLKNELEKEEQENPGGDGQ